MKKPVKIILIVLLVIVLLIVLVSCLAGGSSSDKGAKESSAESSSEALSESSKPAEESSAAESSQVPEESSKESSQEASQESSQYYFKDMQAVTKDCTINITDWKVIPVGESGNEYGDSPVLAIWYDTTNTSGKQMDPSTAWISIMTVVQDNDPNAVNQLEMGLMPDDQFTDSQLQKIKKDGTVSNAVAYQLTDTTTPVEISAVNGILGEDIGTITFDIANGTTSNGGDAAKGGTGTPANQAKEEASFKDGRIVTDDFTIEITNYKVIPVGETGNEYGDSPVIAFWYNTTNTSGNKIDPDSAWIYAVRAYQDNDPNAENELQTALLPDDQFTDTQMQDIKPGGTVANAMAYELTDTTTPVTLKVTNGLLGADLGSQDFAVEGK